MIRFLWLLLLMSGTALAQLPVLPPYLSSSSSGSTLLNGLVGAWDFNEQVTSGNRTEPINSTVLKDAIGNAAGIRGMMYGSVAIPIGAGRLTNVDNAVFGPGNTFTIAAWCIGQDGANSWIGESTNSASTGDCYRFRPDGSCQIVDNGAVTHTINLTLNNPDYAWNLIVMGCDGVNMFASANGAAPTTTACTSVRKTGCPFWCNTINSAVDGLYIWNRALTSAEIASLYRGGQGFEYPFTATPSIATQVTSNYLWAVVNAGAAAPAQASLNAITTLVAGFVTDGTWGKFTNVTTFIPDSLTAAIMPILPFTGYDGGATTWRSSSTVNNGFIGASLSINGLTGNSSRTLGSVVPGFTMNGTSSHMAAYVYTATQTGFDTGAQVGATIFALAGKNSDGKAYSYNGAVANVISPTSSGNGFYMATRVSSTDHRLFFASSGTAWAQIGATDAVAAGGFGTSQPIQLFGVQSDGLESSDTISGFTAGAGLTTSEGQSVYNRWQTFRTALGGGFR